MANENCPDVQGNEGLLFVKEKRGPLSSVLIHPSQVKSSSNIFRLGISIKSSIPSKLIVGFSERTSKLSPSLNITEVKSL
jgi:hypothetical protein